MENNLTNYLRLKKTPIKLELEEQNDFCDDFSPNYFQWTPDSTNLLLKLRFDDERHLKFEDRSFQRKELWDEIAAEMNRIIGVPHQVSGDVCDLKYRNMLHTYKKNRNKERNGTDPENISWCYYEIFKQSLKNNEEKDTSQAEDTNDNSQIEESTNNINNKRKRLSNKPEMMEIQVTPNLELRAPSARLSNKRLHNALVQAQQQQQHSTAFNEPDLKFKVVDYEHRSQSRALQTNLSGLELEECRVFGEAVGIQLSLIKSPETRALAELKIQEILYAAKVSKLKE